MLGLPKSVYERCDKVVKGCKVCGTSVSSPPRARISGMRASEFGDVIFVDHQEIQFRTAEYIVLLVLRFLFGTKTIIRKSVKVCG